MQPYALSLGGEPRAALARARAYAEYRGWRVRRTSLWDGCGSSAPGLRPQWRVAERLIAAGFVSGIVTVEEAEVSACPTEYEEILDRLEMWRAFLAHVPDDWAPQPGTASAGG